jgi:ribosomal protein L11 methylase PrmA
MKKLFAFPVCLIALAAALAPATRADDKKDDPKIVVPYVPTKPEVVQAMLKLAAIKQGDTVYDLGCGDGRIVIAAVKDFNAKRGLGIDFNPERLKDCEKSMDAAKLTDEQRKRLTFKQGDVLKMKPEDFKDVDVVTMYLLPSVNLELRPILQKGLKPGSRIVSNSFDMGDWKADKEERVTVKIDGASDREYTIYLWTIKGGK